MAVADASVPELPVITPADRLTFTAFLAIALHAALIFGVSFTYLESRSSSQTMEVTLAQHETDRAPDDVDFLAQANQQGSGTLEEAALTTSPNESEFQDTVVQETMPEELPRPVAETKPEVDPVLTSAESSTRKALQDDQKQTESEQPKDNQQKSLRERSLEIASLEARLDRKRQMYAKRPRIKRLTSLSTASSVDANYLNSWRRKIEKIGNLNYPREASRRNIYGNLRLMVAILPDGSLKEVELLESSGYEVLDNAAIRIVKLSAPFPPFPDELRQTTDILEIIRTWQFRENSSLRSYAQ
ncbi:MAG: energy transducer TonB [Pseudomonadales bacterium]